MSTAPQLRLSYHARLASAADAEMVQRFNARLGSGGVTYRLPRDFMLPGEKEFRPTDYPVFRELLLLEDSSEMRAGVLLQHGAFCIAGEQRPFCWLQLPLSEGLVSREYATAFPVLMREALRLGPFSASLGIGSMQEPYARFLARSNWKHQAVPFVFYPVKPKRVLMELQQTRHNPLLRLAARSGAATLGGWTLAAWRRCMRFGRQYSVSLEAQFGPWADDVFGRSVSRYGATPRRDAAALNILYPPSEPQYLRLRVRRHGEDIGWLLLLCTPMRGNKYFGNLTVGTIVTGFGDPAHVPTLLQAGVDHLVDRGAELVVANWSHRAWLRGSRHVGFLTASSNFLLFVSPAGAPLLSGSCPLDQIHLTRGDCDSPSSLMAPRAS